MRGVFRGGDAPEVESVSALLLGVDDHLDEEGGADHELAVGIVGGGMGVVTDTSIIIDDGGSDRNTGGVIRWGSLRIWFGRGRCGGAIGFGAEGRGSICKVSKGSRSNLGDIESGKAGAKLVLEVLSGLGGKMVALADVEEEIGKDRDLGGVAGRTDSETLGVALAPEAGFVFVHGLKNVVERLGEVDDPGMGGIEIMRFFEAKISHF